MATACVIHYELHTNMVIRYLKGEYIGESRDADKILAPVSPYICEVNCVHIKHIINQGCPSHLDFEKDYLTGKVFLIAEPWINLHDRIKPTSKLCKVKPRKNIN